LDAAQLRVGVHDMTGVEYDRVARVCCKRYINFREQQVAPDCGIGLEQGLAHALTRCH
jgi:hypothetical protein